MLSKHPPMYAYSYLSAPAGTCAMLYIALENNKVTGTGCYIEIGRLTCIQQIIVM